MTYDDDTDEVILSTGKKFYAYGGVAFPADDGQVSYGSDGGTYGEQFTAEERSEIARAIIAAWERWRDGDPRPNSGMSVVGRCYTCRVRNSLVRSESGWVCAKCFKDRQAT